MPLGLMSGLGSTSPAAASTDQWAYQVTLRAAPSLPEPQRQYAMTVARGEGYYGRGWTGEGAGSNNWGAVQGAGSAGSFQWGDHHADGSPYTTAFKKYLTPEEGFLDMAAILLKPNVKAALARGNLSEAVTAQRSNFYFEASIQDYLTAVTRNYNELTTTLGWPRLLAPGGTGSWVPWAIAGTFAAASLTWYVMATKEDLRRLSTATHLPLDRVL